MSSSKGRGRKRGRLALVPAPASTPIPSIFEDMAAFFSEHRQAKLSLQDRVMFVPVGQDPRAAVETWLEQNRLAADLFLARFLGPPPLEVSHLEVSHLEVSHPQAQAHKEG
jgi:hypothetical protein